MFIGEESPKSFQIVAHSKPMTISPFTLAVKCTSTSKSSEMLIFKLPSFGLFSVRTGRGVATSGLSFLYCA